MTHQWHHSSISSGSTVYTRASRGAVGGSWLSHRLHVITELCVTQTIPRSQSVYLVAQSTVCPHIKVGGNRRCSAAAAALGSCPHPSCLPRSTLGLLFSQQSDDNPPLPHSLHRLQQHHRPLRTPQQQQQPPLGWSDLSERALVSIFTKERDIG